MSEPNAQNIVYLVERLRAAHQVTWEEVESLLSDFPGWLHGVQLLRDHPESYRSPYGFPEPPTESVYVPGAARERMIELFQPYALLLSERHAPAERIARLQEAGVDVEPFCKECLHNACAAVVTAATETLEASEAEQTLLRMAAKQFEETGTLLRTASQTGEDGALLTPSSEPSESLSPSGPTRRSWLQRLLGRHP
ncbi:MAG TPA: hypothetical protein VKT32_14085 [Chthonomonadaceae bacterium]|nr:hypothetical protein [Chthonomonadaceae bacterium]